MATRECQFVDVEVLCISQIRKITKLGITVCAAVMKHVFTVFLLWRDGNGTGKHSVKYYRSLERMNSKGSIKV